MEIIDGRLIANQIKNEVADGIHRLPIKPGLAAILVGDNPASLSYVKSKEKACAVVGIHSEVSRESEYIWQNDLFKIIDEYNEREDIHGILVQLPLPSGISERKIIERIDPKKDVDGFHPINIGKMIRGEDCFLPATPAGIQELLVRSNIQIEGKHVVVVGRSNIVGKPIANMLLQKNRNANATVTIVHSKTPYIEYFTLQADILIVAIGKPHFITADMVKEGACVIDVGINRVEDSSMERGYRLVGDVDYENVKDKTSAITPVPGGVGPMTIAMLLKNTLKAASFAVDNPKHKDI